MCFCHYFIIFIFNFIYTQTFDLKPSVTKVFKMNNVIIYYSIIYYI